MHNEATRRIDVRAMGTTLSIYGPAPSFAPGADVVIETFRDGSNVSAGSGPTASCRA